MGFCCPSFAKLPAMLILMFLDIEQKVRVVFDDEVETDITGHARLPDAGGLVVLLRAK